MPQELVQNLLSYVPMIGMVVLCICLMIIPQRKKDKKFKKMMDALKPGDNIKTIGCIYGKVVSIKEDLVVIESGPMKTQLQISKDGIAAVENGEISKDK